MTPKKQISPVNKSATHAVSSGGNAYNHHGSLRSKLVLSLAAMFFVFLTADEMVRQQVVKPEFAALERDGAIRDAHRVLAAMNEKVAHLGDLAKHWAGRLELNGPTDGMEQAAGDAQQTQQHKRPSPDLAWAAVVDEQGAWRWLYLPDDSADRVRGEDGGGSPEFSLFQGNNSDRLAEIGRRCIESDADSIRGMTRVGDNSLMMFASAVIDSSGTSQPSQPTHENRRHLIIGRAIDQPMVASLKKQTQVDFSLQSIHNQDSKQPLTVWEADESILSVEFQLSNHDNEPIANVLVRVPREITARSSQATALARNSFIFCSVGALLLLLLLLQRIVIGPLVAIREHSDRVAERGFDTEPLVLPGNDEISDLASAFDHMMRRLGNAQTQLTEASGAAGRSQVASTVIHNVGNVLTNVNSLLDDAADRVECLRIQPLSKLADRLKQEDSGGAMLEATPDYLDGLAASLNADRDTISQLMKTLHDNIRHIHDVIRDQQQYTGPSVTPTVVVLRDVIGEAIGCCRSRLTQDSVEVDVSGCLEVEVRSDRSLLLQSVINVIGNAREALRQKTEGTRTLSILADVQGDMVAIIFRDNGIGMTPDTLQKVFDAHFTTRKTGCGLGLHFCANTLKRLGGSIHAVSDGPGFGATFVIEVPLAASTSPPSPIALDDVSIDAIGTIS